MAYWVSSRFLDIFKTERNIDDIAPPRIGMMTTDNNRFLRFWHEIQIGKIGFHYSSINQAQTSSTKWFPYNKGGSYRKWAGNSALIVNWQNGGQEIKDAGMTSFRGKEFYFQEGITWGDVSSAIFSCRYTKPGKIFDIKGTSCFPSPKDLPVIMSVLNSQVGVYILGFLNPTVSFQSGDIRRIPIPYDSIQNLLSSDSVNYLIKFTSSDWDSYETSWDFSRPQLLLPDYHLPTLFGSYQKLRAYWYEITMEVQRLEEANNCILINAYGLEEELNSDIPLNEITLTCNPHYRYGGDKSEEELEVLLLADTMKEFISYGVGCMFGRYALDKPGLVLANQGETIEDYLQQIPEPTFPADDDNVIPMLDGDWFTDDISERFRKFLRVTFGDEHYEANLKFIEKALGKDIRKYFLKDFYNDHVRRYKKRPIYWLFSSPKGSFNALIYLHRYRPDTVSVILNDYLREFRTKLSANLDNLKRVEASVEAAKGEKTKALKEIETLKKTIDELDTWERDVLYPLATEQIDLDLDDGVKVNYQKFGTALKKIPGLDSKEE